MARNEEQEIVLIGVGQCVQKDVDPGQSDGPVELMAEAARAAAADTSLGAAVMPRLDLVATVDTFAWQPANAAALLAGAIGATPQRLLVSTVGGNTPQAYVNHLAGEVRAGRAGTCLIAGVNVVASMRRARKAGRRLDWPSGGEGTAERFGDDRLGGTDIENAHGLFLPSNTYPLFENALRSRRGLDVATHNLRIGEMFARFTEVAARHPQAWFPVQRSAAEIATPSASNRMVAFPYTKFMNAVMEVDQAAAVIVTSAANARRLGVPEDRWVWFLGGGAAAEDPWNVSERPRFDACPSMAFAAAQALARAGLGVDDLDRFDLYSCFPVAVELACESLGISETDPRGLTVTGGLPYFGGPGNNYTLHAIASMADVLRTSPGANGLVTANGWYLTKHAAGVYSSAPPAHTPRPEPAPELARHPEGAVEVCPQPSGTGTIETWTVVFGRTGEPETGIVLGRLEDGARFLAHTPSDPALLDELVTRDAIGRRGRVTAGSPVNLFTPE